MIVEVWGRREEEADGRSRDVVSEVGGGKNLRRKETGLELCSVYDAASFHTSPSFMLLSQLLQSTVALLQINSDGSQEQDGWCAAGLTFIKSRPLELATPDV